VSRKLNLLLAQKPLLIKRLDIFFQALGLLLVVKSNIDLTQFKQFQKPRETAAPS